MSGLMKCAVLLLVKNLRSALNASIDGNILCTPNLSTPVMACKFRKEVGSVACSERESKSKVRYDEGIPSTRRIWLSLNWLNLSSNGENPLGVENGMRRHFRTYIGTISSSDVTIRPDVALHTGSKNKKRPKYAVTPTGRKRDCLSWSQTNMTTEFPYYSKSCCNGTRQESESFTGGHITNRQRKEK